MSWNKHEELVERGSLIETIKSPDSYLALFVGILIVGFLWSMPWIAGEDFEIAGIPIIIVMTIIVITVVKNIMKKIYIYEHGIMFDDKYINYYDINSIQLETKTRIVRRRLYQKIKVPVKVLVIDVKDEEEKFIFNVDSYGLKKLKLLTRYLEEYTNINVKGNYEYLELEEYKDKKDIKISIIVMVIFAIIAFLVIKFHFIPLGQKYD